jgi:hypothetical protein
MATSGPSMRRHLRDYTQRKRAEGCKQINMWLAADLVEPIQKMATDLMVPFGVAVEMKLREAVLGAEK